MLAGFAIDARADDVGVFTIQHPGRLSLTLFGSRFGADTYATTQPGFPLKPSISHYVAAVGRVTTYQVYQVEGYKLWRLEARKKIRNHPVQPNR